MDKIIEVQDILFNARSFVECVFLAAGQLQREEVDPLQAVADIASKKIDEAIALLDEYCHAGVAEGSSPVQPVPSAKPASRAARTKRTRK